MSEPKPLRAGVLLSGTGRTFENFLRERAAGRLAIDFACLISSDPKAGGIAFAEAANVPVHVLRSSEHSGPDDYGRAIGEVLREHRVELAVMAGFLHLWTLPEDFRGRTLNIHPSLLPSFGGRGFYGSRVHRAVVEAGVKVSGCTVHFADDEYDTGPIVIQRAVPVTDEDDADSVAAKVFAEECVAYPEALRLFASGRLQCDGRRVRILPREDAAQSS